jgi:hypothetical protein
MQQGLRPPHGKHRHHGHAAARGEALQGRAELGHEVFVRVLAVAVGGFDQHRVGGRRIGRRVHQQVVGAAEVAREQDAVPGHFQQQAGRAQDVPGG